MKNCFICFILVISLILSSCRIDIETNSDKSQTNNIVEYNLKTVTIQSALLSNLITNNNNGAYQILNHWNNTGIITYYDFETMNKVVLSSDMNNAYTKDSTAYVDSVLGGVIPVVVNDNLFVIKNGSKILAEMSSGEDGFAKIIKMELNGSSRKELKLPSYINMDLNSVFLSDDDENLYTLTYNIGQSVDDIKICLTKLDVNNGSIDNIYNFENYDNLKLLKGYDNQIILYNAVHDKENQMTDKFNIYKFDILTQKLTKIIELSILNNSFVIGKDCLYFSNKSNNLIKKIYFDNLDEVTLLNSEIVSQITLYDYYDNRIIASFITDDNDFEYISIDSNGNIYPLEHYYSKNGGLKFMGIFGETDDDFIISIQDTIVDYTMKNSVGSYDTIKMPIMNFALINKEDYWNNKPNYRLFIDSVEYTNIPEK